MVGTLLAAPATANVSVVHIDSELGCAILNEMKSSRTWQTGIESGSLMVNEQLETELTLEGDSQ